MLAKKTRQQIIRDYKYVSLLNESSISRGNGLLDAQIDSRATNGVLHPVHPMANIDKFCYVNNLQRNLTIYTNMISY